MSIIDLPTSVDWLPRLQQLAGGVVVDADHRLQFALLDAFELTQENRWLERAAAVAGLLTAKFLDSSTGALRDRPVDAASPVAVLDRPYYPIADAPSPSGNGAAALGLLRLHASSGDASARDVATGILRAFGGTAAQLGSSAATYIKAVSWATLPVTTVVIVDTEESVLLRTALRSPRPRTVVRRFAPGSVSRGSLPPEIAAMLTGDAPRAYVCAGRTCAAPVSDADALAALLRDFHG